MSDQVHQLFEASRLLTRFKKMMRSSFTPCDNKTSIALMHEPPVARVISIMPQPRLMRRA